MSKNQYARPCPLCDSPLEETAWSIEWKRRGTWHYRDCPVCRLVSVDPCHLPNRAMEKERYDAHKNDPEDERYIQHLSRLADPVAELLDRLTRPQDASASCSGRREPGESGAADSRGPVESHDFSTREVARPRGFDYGCGPTKVMELIFRRRGYEMESFDPIYHPDQELLQRSYEFVTCSEAAEHFHDPAQEFERLFGLVKPGGILGIMTNILYDEIDFESWWYTRDPTHVVFYREETFRWLGKKYNARLNATAKDVVVLEKKSKKKARAKKAKKGQRQKRGRD